MHRQDILGRLRRYRDHHKTEAPTVDRFLAFVEAHDDCFKRSQLTGHVTGSAWILDKAGTRVLLTHHRKLDRWLQPGGHADGNSHVEQVAMKEANEESGLRGLRLVTDEIFDVDIHEIPARGAEPAHYHFDCRFLLQAVHSDEYVVSDESHDLAWVSLGEVIKYNDEVSMQRMVKKTKDSC